MVALVLIAKLLAYVLAARMALLCLKGTYREAAFALVNVIGYYAFFVFGTEGGHGLRWWGYIPVVLFLYAAMNLYSTRQDWTSWLAFFAPIFVLVILRYTPVAWYAHFSAQMQTALRNNSDFSIAVDFIGISYLAFRCSYLVLQVRNGAVKKPGFWEYIGFCFFVPTMAVGPINHYSNYRRGFETDAPSFPVGTSLLRVIVGCVKFFFLGNIFNQLTYSGLLLDDHYHQWIDLPIAAFSYYLYLYCNFSGYCDAAIGIAGLMGIPVTENFQDPFVARNVKEFWNRWHITLSTWMRDVVFSPISKFLTHLLGLANVNHAIALTILFVFFLVGIWHGVGWNYAVFGMIHGIGVVTNHYYNIGLKKWLGREGLKIYNSNSFIRALAIILTFCYVAASMFFFANSPHEMKEIWLELR
jgi:D-alanyl-lipoteichoic acid acyltransferase DltB (MBOAT superfamily)